MSVLATRQRSERRERAVAGGSHDRLIGLLRIALPVIACLLVALLTLAPLTVGRDISFVLSKDRVDVAPERMRVSRAVYRGRDGKGQPFQLDARSAVQATSSNPIVQLQTLNAHIQLSDGPALIRAGRGRYDMDTARVALDGPVALDDSGGYHMRTSDMLLDTKTRVAVSRGAVTGTMPLGHFSADRMHADLDSKIVRLTGRARLHIVQGGSRARR